MNKTATYKRGEGGRKIQLSIKKKSTKVKNQLKQSQQIQCNPRRVFFILAQY